MTFKQKVCDPSFLPWLYEIVPPTKNFATHELDNFLGQFIPILSQLKIDAVNIPEIVCEEREKSGYRFFSDHVEPRVIGKILAQKSHEGLEPIINRICVHENLSCQKKWLWKTFSQFKITNLIIVGGRLDNVCYPGPSVIKMAKFITQKLNPKIGKMSDLETKILDSSTDFFCGGICIPHRRSKVKKLDEPYKLLAKQKAGIEFFTTQVLYEPKALFSLLHDYSSLCQKENLKPRRIFLSFAPVSSWNDLLFLEQLGVVFPEEMREKISLSKKGDILKISFETILKLVKEIFSWKKTGQNNVPLGINIEYIGKHNLKPSFRLIRLLKQNLKT